VDRTNGRKAFSELNRAVAQRDFHFYTMKFLLARKGRMTQVFEEDGSVFAGTVLTVGPNVITRVKTVESDGYNAVQVGADTQKVERMNKPQAGQAFKVLKEFRVDNPTEFTVGASIAADTFEQGETVVVAGTSKGHGFSGVVKRHGFHGGRRSHGQKHSEREAGSIGGGPGRAGGRVTLGMRMAGRMGSDRVTVPNLKILRVDAKNGQIIVSGAVPGAPGSVVEIVSK
jgi:large subunit ribosomal protein L3